MHDSNVGIPEKAWNSCGNGMQSCLIGRNVWVQITPISSSFRFKVSSLVLQSMLFPFMTLMLLSCCTGELGVTFPVNHPRNSKIYQKNTTEESGTFNHGKCQSLLHVADSDISMTHDYWRIWITKVYTIHAHCPENILFSFIWLHLFSPNFLNECPEKCDWYHMVLISCMYYAI